MTLLCAIGVWAAAQSEPKPEQKSATKAITPKGPSLKNPVAGHLVRVQTITTPSEVAQVFFPPLRCDSDGNYYFPTEVVGAPVIHKLNPRGQKVASFRPDANPDLKVDLAAWYALDPGTGELYQLVDPHVLDRYVYVYKSDGTLKSTIKLQTGFPFFPNRLAIFPSGQFLVAGDEYDADRTAAMWPFTGIFAPDGRLLKELELEDDQTLHDMAASGDARVVSPTNSQSNLAIDYGLLEMGTDGNAYLVRWGNPAIFYTISAGGQVVRRFTVDAGESGYRPAGFHITGNRIAILFWDRESADEVMKIVDLEGHDIATYEAPKGAYGGDTGLGSSFACYTENPTRFTFLGADDNRRVQFWIAEPR